MPYGVHLLRSRRNFCGSLVIISAFPEYSSKLTVKMWLGTIHFSTSIRSYYTFLLGARMHVHILTTVVWIKMPSIGRKYEKNNIKSNESDVKCWKKKWKMPSMKLYNGNWNCGRLINRLMWISQLCAWWYQTMKRETQTTN